MTLKVSVPAQRLGPILQASYRNYNLNFLAPGAVKYNLNLPLMWVSRLISCLIVYFRERKMPLAAGSLHQDAYHASPRASKVKSRPQVEEVVGERRSGGELRPGARGQGLQDSQSADWLLGCLALPALSCLRGPEGPGLVGARRPVSSERGWSREGYLPTALGPGLVPSQPKTTPAPSQRAIRF